MRSRVIMVAVLLLGLLHQTEGANRYIRAGAAAGANNGTSWANAYTNFSSVSWSRTNMYYVASGHYNEYVSITCAESGTNWLTIKKANAADNESDVGWDASYATDQTVIMGRCQVMNGYFRMDGVTGSGTSGHGIKVWLNHKPASGFNAVIVFPNGSVSPRELHHIEALGPGFAFGDTAFSGIYYNSSIANTKGFRVSSCWIHEIPNNGVSIGCVQGTSYADYGMLFESNVVSETGGVAILNPGIHGQGMQIAYNSRDNYTIIRGNVFRNVFGQGEISFLGLGSHANSRIYNNIFCSTNPSYYNGTHACCVYMHEVSSCVSNMYVVNNTVYNIGGYSAMIRNSFTGTAVNVQVMNNLWVKCVFGAGHSGTTSASNNDYYLCAGAYVPSGEPGQRTEPADPFIDSAIYDLHLRASANAVDGGVDLSALFSNDLENNNRPNGPAFDIGAYEHVGETIPNAPTSFSLTPVFNSNITLSWRDDSDVEAGFNIYRSTNGTIFSLRDTVPSNQTNYNEGGLSPFLSYWYYVKATNLAGESAATPTLKAANTPVRITGAAMDWSGGFVIVWLGETNMLYTVQASSNLAVGFTADLHTGIPGAAPTMNIYTDATATALWRFYRLKVE